jgi:hypothetical protein
MPNAPKAAAGSRERPRNAKRLERCRSCGSDDLFDGFFGPDGLATTGHGEGDTWLTSCNGCGDFYRVG